MKLGVRFGNRRVIARQNSSVTRRIRDLLRAGLKAAPISCAIGRRLKITDTPHYVWTQCRIAVSRMLPVTPIARFATINLQYSPGSPQVANAPRRHFLEGTLSHQSPNTIATQISLSGQTAFYWCASTHCCSSCTSRRQQVQYGRIFAETSS